jgi:hypothetical protein
MSNTVKIKGGKMAKSKDQGCGNCAAYIPEGEDGEGGTCHRKAPHCMMEGAMNDGSAYATCWPWVDAADWCAEWIAEAK